jgi:Domain of unknown function (DUF4338)
MESDKENLINKFNELFKEDNIIQNISVFKEQKSTGYIPLFIEQYYEMLTFKAQSLDDVLNIKINVIFAETKEHIDIFNYFRHNVSSMPQTDIPGRILRILIKDDTSQKYLGIMQMSTDLLNSELKDQYIGLDKKNKGRLKKHIRDNSVNLSLCVPLQPFGYNVCGGKLLAMLAFSKEIINHYNNKFESNIAMIVTTSIHGKSIQYDRLKELKYIGLTRGYGTCHINENLYEDCIKFINKRFTNMNTKKMSKRRILNITLQTLNLGREYLNHKQQRGIYIGFTGTKSKSFLSYKNKEDTKFENDLLKNVDEICEFWKKRWAVKRLQNILNKI